MRSLLLAAVGTAAALGVSGFERVGARETALPTLPSVVRPEVLLPPVPDGPTRVRAVGEFAQAPAAQDSVIRQIEKRGFSKVTGLMRRGQNYVFQAVDPYGERVRVVMNAHTGEIVGLSRIVPRKK